jgi:hypothetical protein
VAPSASAFALSWRPAFPKERFVGLNHATAIAEHSASAGRYGLRRRCVMNHAVLYDAKHAFDGLPLTPFCLCHKSGGKPFCRG